MPSDSNSGNLIWRRCASCGQLTLVPMSASVCWQCGAPIKPARSPDDVPPLASSPSGQPRHHAPRPNGSVHAPTAYAPDAEHVLLTPAERESAERLLRSVFPDD